ncbi:MAG: ERF family protein [Rhizobiaceae bacterium]
MPSLEGSSHDPPPGTYRRPLADCARASRAGANLEEPEEPRCPEMGRPQVHRIDRTGKESGMNANALTIDHDQATEVAPRREASNAVTPMDMIDRALATNASPDTLERLLALQERWEAGQARKAFDAALAQAKSEIPVILKNRRVGYEHKNGSGETSYRHEDLGEIARTVDPILAKYGLSYRFNTTSEINQPISVTCIVAHRDGHSEKNTLTAGRDDSGKKNSIQAIGSTITYLQRYTLKAALGLAAAADDDGAKADKTEDDHPIDAKQIEMIEKAIKETNTDTEKFLEWLEVPSIAEIPASQMKRVMQSFDAIRRRAGR